MTKKRATLILFIFLVIFSVGITAFFYHKSSDSRFLETISNELLVDNLEDNSLITHFMLKNPNKFGIDTSSAKMPIYSSENEKETQVKLNMTYQKLLSLNDEKLSKQEIHVKNALMFYLSHQIKLSEYSYLAEPFTPNSGEQNELPILLTEYAFESEEDVKTYLDILNLIPDYLNSLCQFEKEKAELGYFMSDTMVDSVIEGLDSYCNVLEENNPLLLSFNDRIENLCTNGNLSRELADTYIADNKRLITTVFQPAYEKTGDELLLLKSCDGSPQVGLSYYPNGKQYYELLVSQILGEDMNIPALKSVFSTKLIADMQELNCLVASNPEYFVNLFTTRQPTDPLVQYEADECLTILKDIITEEFPDTGLQYPYEVKQVSNAMQSSTNPAYYFTPPIDDPKQNIIYINSQYTQKGINLFTTLAHEGFPGHMYQSISTALHYKNSGIHSLSGIAHYGGYTEGYATYVEFNSYQYAKEVAKKLTSDDQYSLYYDYLSYNRSICLNLYSILDIMIHYEGAGIEEIRPYLAKIGIKQDRDIQEIYNYIVMEPGTYITYFGGYLKILECKNLAKDCLEDHYTDKKFHTILLNTGPMNFEEIRKAIRSHDYY